MSKILKTVCAGLLLLAIRGVQDADAQATESSIVVVTATWGTADQQLDVTQKIQDMINAAPADGSFTPGHKNLGDPAPKKAKDLQITYTVNGKTINKTFKGGEKPISLASLISEAPLPEVAAPVTPPADPMLWKPDPAKPLESILADDAYAKQKAALLKGIDRKGLADTVYPAFGLRVVRVMAGQEAANRGMLAGNIIKTVGGKENPTEQDLVEVMSDGKAFTLNVYEENAGLSDMKFAGGDPGIQAEPFAALAKVYWLSGPRDARWDDDMLTATRATMNYNLPLAITALKHAQDAGCDTDYVAVIRAISLAMSDKHEEALAVGLPMAKKVPAELKEYFMWLLDEAAVGSYHLDLPPDLNAITTEQADWIEAAIKFQKDLPQAERVSRRPLMEASQRTFKDFSDALETVVINPEIEQAPSITNADWMKKKAMTLNAPTGKLHILAFGPQLQDLVYSIDLKVNSSSPETTIWRDTATMVLVGQDPKKDGSGQMIRIDVLSDGKVRLYNVFTTQKPWFGDHKKHTLTLGQIGSRIEMSIDGQSVYDGPSPLKSPAYGKFLVSGMVIELTKLEWKAVEPVKP
jgi:hypothetical protein